MASVAGNGPAAGAALLKEKLEVPEGAQQGGRAKKGGEPRAYAEYRDIEDTIDRLIGPGHEAMLDRELVNKASMNEHKNRYSNIFPMDSHLVGLSGGQYINASLLPLPDSAASFQSNFPASGFVLKPSESIAASRTNTTDGFHNYVIASGPMHPSFHGPDTTGDFWRMCWEQRPCAVVCLAKVQAGFSGCSAYFPFHSLSLPGTHSGGDALTPVHLSQEREGAEADSEALCVCEYDGDLRVSLLTEEALSSGIILRHLKITRRLHTQQQGESDPLFLDHFHFVSWPNYGIPNCEVELAGLLDLTFRTCEQTQWRRPLVVHCSGGVGRSGTFVAAHASASRVWRLCAKVPAAPVEKLLDEVRIPQDVLLMRQMRHPWMVEGWAQYSLVYQAVAAAIGGRHLPQQQQ
uniref:Protein-tyrosine-phosphatase n=1 Tax=Chromera velia CCMP2878 TaxID=1169474 RepID=A0A0G4HWP2_9ALVE|eukprot:Cvel_32702.t1-p1 / transcript=Cvel_32702.t1 / gene=Cvel_32702 / organism=Chromera_velia_CCMP2878 / gene_product=Receptor-type tyrosine-protein phosphatase H, putative / transcript_product=Receptor-type tyrosine-protein phosphatase H, putative / location=Cvel_scaffold5149:3137-4766(-) / protein_length=404 / sequence_SO=supercontig / SO=protein_coding / is_pseudo=false